MRVLVADDHALFRDGVVSLLEAAGHEVVGEVGDGEAAVEAVKVHEPDLVLLDVAMPRMGGLEALRRIKEHCPRLRVVMLTVADDDTLFEAIRAGADGYLLKSLKADEFLGLLRALERGEAAMTGQTTARLLAGFSALVRRSADAPDTLTAREAQLLQLVAGGSSNKAIARALSISGNTVKYHMKNILQKLGAKNRTEAATIAVRKGLIPDDSGAQDRSGAPRPDG